jgi:hypothetical protein
MDLAKMQSVQLFSEATTAFGGVDLLVEQQSTKDRPLLKIKGPFLVAEKRNGNGRLYRKSIMDIAVEEYNRDYISCGRALGELGHPDRFEPVFQDSCIKIEELKCTDEDPNVWIGSAVVLQSDPSRGIKGTAPGDALASMLQYGVKVGVSSRALGQMNEDKIIDTYLKLCAVDVVYNPSAPGAYVDGILESRQFLLDEHGNVFEKAFKSLDENLKTIPSKFKTEHLMNAFKTFMNDIKQK